MKRKISDMLDAYGEAELNFEQNTPLSSERIRELIMSKITKKEQKPRRIAFRVLAAAAIIVTLAVSVFAAGNGAEWFRDYFLEKNGEVLSDEQLVLIEENAVPIGLSETINRYTLNVESVMSDEKTLYIKLNLYAPEGVVIPSGEDYSFEQMSLLIHGKEQPWKMWEYAEMDDEDKTDNHIGIIMRILFEDDADTSFLLPGGGATLKMRNLSKSYGFHFDRKTEQLAEGTWEFDLQFATTEDIQWMCELITEPVPCMMKKNINEEETEIYLTSVSLRALSLNVVYDYPDGADLEQLNWRGTKAVMKDGTSVNMSPAGGCIEPGETQITGYIDFEADAPIVQEEVSYIEFPGGVQIPVNAE